MRVVEECMAVLYVRAKTPQFYVTMLDGVAVSSMVLLLKFV